MNKFFRPLAPLFALFLAANAWGVPITGSLDFSGTIKLNGNWGVATGALASSAFFIQGDGAFEDVIDPSAVSFAAFQWNTVNVPVTSLWSFTDFDSGWVYSFSLSTITGFNRTSTDLDVAGIGSLFITGAGSTYEETAGRWSLSITDEDGVPNSKSGKFGFSSNSGVPVPDTGIPLALLGFTLLGFALKHGVATKPSARRS